MLKKKDARLLQQEINKLSIRQTMVYAKFVIKLMIKTFSTLTLKEFKVLCNESK